MDRLMRLRSKSTLISLTLTMSPTFRTSETLFTRSLLISLMWTRPSMPGRMRTNAPNLVMETTGASNSEPMGYSFLSFSQGLSSYFL